MAAHGEWSLLPPDVREHMTFDHYVSQRREHARAKQDRRPRNQNRDLEDATSKLTLPLFDGSGKVTARSWIHKLDTSIYNL